MIEGDDKTCPVAGCTRHKHAVPMCRPHWITLSSPQRRLLLELEECDPVAFGVALVLAAEWISDEAPAWGKGWSEQKMRKVSKQRRRAQALEAQRKMIENVRSFSRKRYAAEYDERTRRWREVLERVLPLVGNKRTALEVALAMIRGGHGTDGYCPLLVCAALDIDDRNSAGASETALAV